MIGAVDMDGNKMVVRILLALPFALHHYGCNVPPLLVTVNANTDQPLSLSLSVVLCLTEHG